MANSKIELQHIDKYLFQICGLPLTNLLPEKESQAYAAHNFDLGKNKYKYRSAKITPKKAGQFVTLWFRMSTGIIAPFDVNDDIDFYIIAIRNEKKMGLFIFPKEILFQRRVLSGHGKEGKRGFRVYPNWDLTISKQAQQTQSWQKLYFLDLSNENQIDVKKGKCLLGM